MPESENSTLTISKSLLVTLVMAVIGSTYMFGAWNNTTVTDHKTLIEVQRSLVDLRVEVTEMHALLREEIDARKRSEASLMLAPRLYNGK